MENDALFHQLFSRYVDAATKHHAPPVSEQIDLWNQCLRMIEEKEVSPAGVVGAVSDLFPKNPFHRLFYLDLMRSILITSAMTEGHSYPEFFWIIVKSNVLFDETNININDFMPIIADICDHQVLRSYLIFRLVIEDRVTCERLVRAFYYIGHTVETLKVVTQVFPLRHADLDLYSFVYSDAVSMLYEPEATAFTQEELTWLRAFFTYGVRIDHEGINESSQKALVQLEKLKNHRS